MRAILNNKTHCCLVHNLRAQEWMDIATHSSQANPHPEVSSSEDVVTSWNVMAHGQKSDFVFRRNERVHLNRRGRQFSRLLAAEVCASAVVMLDTPCSEVVWRVLATHSIRQFLPSLPLPCVTVCHHISKRFYLPHDQKSSLKRRDHLFASTNLIQNVRSDYNTGWLQVSFGAKIGLPSCSKKPQQSHPNIITAYQITEIP